MAKPPTFPILIDDTKRITISDLKRFGYLQPNQIKTGTIKWYIPNGNYRRYTAHVEIKVNMISKNPYLELTYDFNGTLINYKVYFESFPSNLGIGKYWYFICPRANRRCRKLYFINTYFLHRTAPGNCMYYKQTFSKNNRLLFSQYYKILEKERSINEMSKPFFKSFYRGKPTRRYLRLLRKIKIDNEKFIEWIREC